MMDFATAAASLRRVTVKVTDGPGSFGSGVLWPHGFVVTNAHVARHSRATVHLADGRRLEGQLMARDVAADLALLRVPGTGIPSASTAEATRVGSFVMAVGHPLGVEGALTMGIVHALGPLQPGGRPWVQADLRLAPGNSGGPLGDASGSVVGVNALVVGALALAIPMREVIRFVRTAGAGRV